MRFDLRPTSSIEQVYLIDLVLYAVIWILFGQAIFRHGPIVAIIGALCISWIPMQLIARFAEHRWLWPPREQYYGYIYGDLIGLPGIAAALALMQSSHHQPSLPDRIWWRSLCALIGLLVGLIFHGMDAHSKAYTQSMMHSPTKLYHDLFVFTVMIALLASKLPLVWESERGVRAFGHVDLPGQLTVLLLVSSLIFWGYLATNYDANPSHRKPHAHIDHIWRR